MIFKHILKILWAQVSVAKKETSVEELREYTPGTINYFILSA